MFGFWQLYSIAVIGYDLIKRSELFLRLGLTNANLLIGDKLPQSSVEILHLLEFPSLLLRMLRQSFFLFVLDGIFAGWLFGLTDAFLMCFDAIALADLADEVQVDFYVVVVLIFLL